MAGVGRLVIRMSGPFHEVLPACSLDVRGTLKAQKAQAEMLSVAHLSYAPLPGQVPCRSAATHTKTHKDAAGGSCKKGRAL